MTIAPPRPATNLWGLVADRLQPNLGYPDDWTPLPHQQPPEGVWTYWWLYGGRGIGKTASGAHETDRRCRAAVIRAGIIAPTLGDARETCVLGESGLLSVNPTIKFNISRGVLTWPNGSEARIYGAYTPEDVERFRGPQHHWI